MVVDYLLLGWNMTVELKVGARPSDFTDSINALLYLINNEMAKIKTTLVVRVVNVNVDTIDVVPVVMDVNASGEPIPVGIVYNIKYIMWQFGTNAIKATPKIGDIGLMLVCKNDSSKSSLMKGVVDSKREYCLRDGIYLGGLFGFNAPATKFIQFDENGMTITSDLDLTINAQNATINASGTANVISPAVNLGTDAGFGVARIGDSVDLTTGKITTGSSIVKAG